MKRFALITPVFTAALLATSAGAIAQTAAPQDAQARYEREREKCMTNNTQDSLATCLREATNALDAARRGQLTSPGVAATENATERCEVFKTPEQQRECVRRVESPPVSGSVAGGGVLRESVTTILVPPNTN